MRPRAYQLLLVVAVTSTSAASVHGIEFDFGRVWNFVLMFVFIFPCVYLHELGHVVAGTLVGIRIDRVVFGSGRTVLRARVGRILFIQKLMPRGAFTFIGEMSKPPTKGALLLLHAGGVLAHLIVVSIAVTTTEFNALDYFAKEALDVPGAFFMANVFLIVANLVPLTFRYQGVEVPNDGLNIFTTPFMEPAKLKAYLAAGAIMRAHDLMEKRQYSAAASILERCIEDLPDSILARIHLAACMLKQLELTRAENMLHHALSLDHEQRYGVPVHNNLAWLHLLRGSDESLERAEKHSVEAYTRDPSIAAVRGTRAGVLTATGKHREALNMIEKDVKLKRRVDGEVNPITGFLILSYTYVQLNRSQDAARYLSVVKNSMTQLDKDEAVLLQMFQNRSDRFRAIT